MWPFNRVQTSIPPDERQKLKLSYAAGAAALETNDWPGAIQAYEYVASSKVFPGLYPALALYYQAHASIQLRDFPKALAYCERAFDALKSLRPTAVLANRDVEVECMFGLHHAMGKIFIHYQDDKSAEEHLRQAEALLTDNQKGPLEQVREKLRAIEDRRSGVAAASSTDPSPSSLV